MKILQVIILFAILLILMNICIAVEKWGNELVLTHFKVTTVEHHYHYDVQSYGTIRLDEKLIGLNFK